MSKTNAELWNLRISDSVIDFVHGGSRTIEEIYIPEHKICLNINNEIVNVFSSDRSRYSESGNKIKDVALPWSLVKKLIKYVKTKKNLQTEVKSIFEKI